jgi:hypothetical protein
VTPEEEIAALRAQLADKDRTISTMSEALRAATARLEAEGEALRVLSERKEAARLKKARQRALKGMSRDHVPEMSPGQTRDKRGTDVLPPPLDGSPPPSIPSSPSPLSSPPSLFPLPSSAARLESLVAEPKPPTRRVKRPKTEKPTDSRHAPLTEALCEYGGWPHHGGRTAKAISVLLAHADRTPGQGGASAIGEVQRRAALARASDGFPRVRELHELAEHWGHFAEAPRGQGPPRADPNAGIVRGTKSECAGCGSEGETANVGEPETRLGYACGCLSEWIATGLKFTEAAPWAERKRHGAA